VCVCFCLAATSVTNNKIPKDTCIRDGLFEDPADCRNYYWCQVNNILPLEVNSLIQFICIVFITSATARQCSL
jgi:hypothetical protein